MRSLFRLVVLGVPLSSALTLAQQAVTTPGGIPAVLPKFSDGTTLINSSVSEAPAGVTIAKPVTINPGELIFPTLTLYSPHGQAEFNSTTGLIFAGADYPLGYAAIVGSGAYYSGGYGVLSFGTANAGTLETQMVLSPYGNLGIGTGTPGGELSIALDNPGNEVGAHIDNTDPTGYSVVRLGTDIESGGGAIHQTGPLFGADPAGPVGPSVTNLTAFEAGGMTLLTTDTYAPIRLFTGGGAPGNERMRITAGGQVGIGTTSPGASLEVNGNMFLTSGSGGYIQFPDGSKQGSAASSTYNATTGIVSFNGPTGAGPTPGIQFSPVAQGVGGTFGAGGSLALQANSLTDTTATGGYVFLGGSLRGDALAGKVYITGNLTPGPAVTTSGIVVNSANNVGLGMDPHADPAARLEVNGNVRLTLGSGANVTFQDSTVQSTAWNGTTLGGDYAEAVDVLGDRAAYEPGDLIVIDSSVQGKFGKSAKPYSKLVAGVFSTKPGLVGRRTNVDRPDKAAEVPMAMLGIVPTKVSTENGAIEPGDLLVSASSPGYAMKGTDRDRMFGATIGKAMQSFNSGTGMIEVLLAIE